MEITRSLIEQKSREALSHKTLPNVSAVLPAFNDAPSLPNLIDELFYILNFHCSAFEIIVVNDGSTDDTAEVLEKLRHRYGVRLLVITHETNLGYGAAIRDGFLAANGEFIFYTDGDGQYNVQDLLPFLFALNDTVDLVNGYKVRRADGRHRKYIGALYNRIVKYIFHLPIRDTDCDFRIIRRSMLNSFRYRSSSGGFCVELIDHLTRANSRIVELPVSHRPRLHGRSQFFRPCPILRTFKELMSLYINTRIMRS